MGEESPVIDQFDEDPKNQRNLELLKDRLPDTTQEFAEALMKNLALRFNANQLPPIL